MLSNQVDIYLSLSQRAYKGLMLHTLNSSQHPQLWKNKNKKQNLYHIIDDIKAALHTYKL